MIPLCTAALKTVAVWWIRGEGRKPVQRQEGVTSKMSLDRVLVVKCLQEGTSGQSNREGEKGRLVRGWVKNGCKYLRNSKIEMIGVIRWIGQFLPEVCW
jgi:hypothetical protein